MTEYPVNHEAPNPAVTLGLDSFGDVHADSSGKRFSDSRIIRNLVDEGVLAEETGVDYFGIGNTIPKAFPSQPATSLPRRSQHTLPVYTSDLRLR
jgi:hypothetical protein